MPSVDGSGTVRLSTARDFKDILNDESGRRCWIFFSGVIREESGLGGKEVIVVMKKAASDHKLVRRYSLLATSNTGALEKQTEQAGAEGF